MRADAADDAAGAQQAGQLTGRGADPAGRRGAAGVAGLPGRGWAGTLLALGESSPLHFLAFFVACFANLNSLPGC